MGQLHFTLQNPKAKPKANQPVIYTDRPSENTLHLILSQDESLGIPTLDVEDRVVVSFSKKLLAEAKAEQVAGGADWEVESVEEHTDYFRFHLQPARTLDFEGQQLIVVFQQLPGRSKTNAEVSVVVSKRGIDINGGNEKLAVMAYPSDHKNLQDVLTASIAFNEQQDDLGHTNIFTSSPTLQPPVANQVRINLSFRGSQLVEAIPSEKHPFFIFSFSYGTRNSDLTDDLKTGEAGFNAFTSAHNIFADLKGQNRWHLQQNTGTTTWRIEPTQINTHLFTRENDSVNLWLDHIISNYPDGDATLYIQWGNIPGYDDGSMTLKVPKRRSKRSGVLRFSAPGGKKEEHVKFGEPIFLNWDVFDAPQVKLVCREREEYNKVIPVPTNKKITPAFLYCGGIVPEEADLAKGCTDRMVLPIIPTIPKLTFYLLAQDQKGNAIGEEKGPATITVDHFPAPTFEEFEAKIEGEVLFFSWEVKGRGALKYKIVDGRDMVVSEGDTTTQFTTVPVRLTEQHPFHPPYIFSTQAGRDGMVSEVVVNVEWKIDDRIEIERSHFTIFSPDSKSMLVSYSIKEGTQFAVFTLRDLNRKPEILFAGETWKYDNLNKLHYCHATDQLYCLVGIIGKSAALFMVSQPFTNLKEAKKPQKVDLKGKISSFAISPDGQLAFVIIDGKVTYFLSSSLPTPELKTIPFDGLGTPQDIFIAPDGKVAFLTTEDPKTDSDNNQIFYFSLEKLEEPIKNKIEVGQNVDSEFPRKMAFSTKTKQAFVTNILAESISCFSYVHIPRKAENIVQVDGRVNAMKISKNGSFAILTYVDEERFDCYNIGQKGWEMIQQSQQKEEVWNIAIAPSGTRICCNIFTEPYLDILKPTLNTMYRIRKVEGGKS